MWLTVGDSSVIRAVGAFLGGVCAFPIEKGSFKLDPGAKRSGIYSIINKNQQSTIGPLTFAGVDWLVVVFFCGVVEADFRVGCSDPLLSGVMFSVSFALSDSRMRDAWANPKGTGTPSGFLASFKNRAWATARLFTLFAIAFNFWIAVRPRLEGFIASGNASSTFAMFHFFWMLSLSLLMWDSVAALLWPAWTVVRFF